MSKSITRRHFIMSAAATTAGVALLRRPVRGYAANESVGFAHIATGGRGRSHLGMSRHGRMAAFCDVDTKRWPKDWPTERGYTDFRKMFDEREKEIDAVIVSTPDHTHFVASYAALMRGKHCYTEKPLTFAPWEARKLAELAAEKKLATQMGNQGHANNHNRLMVATIRSGLIGDVKEIHTWTNRPVWPQGPGAAKAVNNPKTPPDHLDWNNWLAVAADRQYHDKLHAFDWRGWLDFGTGTIGDMGCHTWDGPFWAMNPTYPQRVEIVKTNGENEHTYPNNQKIKFTFPAENGRPAFDAYWYDGGWKADMPADFPGGEKNWETWARFKSGSVFIGTKGYMFAGGDYGGDPNVVMNDGTLVPVRKADKLPGIDDGSIVPPSPGHQNEWLMAVKGEKPWNYPGSNFADYGGPLTETMLLGVIALKTPGQVIECDWQNRKVTTEAAAPFYKPTYRKEWVDDLGVELSM